MADSTDAIVNKPSAWLMVGTHFYLHNNEQVGCCGTYIYFHLPRHCYLSLSASASVAFTHSLTYHSRLLSDHCLIFRKPQKSNQDALHHHGARCGDSCYYCSRCSSTRASNLEKRVEGQWLRQMGQGQAERTSATYSNIATYHWH